MACADIKVGYTCNNNCIHCVISGQRVFAMKTRGNQDRSTEEYKKELIDSKNRGCNAVTFTGGEPTIRKDILELVRFAKSIGLEIGMQTNGRMFYYPSFAKSMAQLGIGYTIALHGHTSDLHERITCAKGSFGQTVQGIKNLILLGQFITGKTVISKLNYQFLKQIVELFISLGVEHVNIAFPHAQGNAWKNFSWVVPTYTEIYPYIKEVINFVETLNQENERKIKVDFEAVPFCFLDGKDNMAVENRFSDWGYIEVKQLDGRTRNWETTRKQIKKKGENCSRCKYLERCEGVWSEYVETFGGAEFKPIL